MYTLDIAEDTVVMIDACQVDFDVVLHIYSANLQQRLSSRDEGGCGNLTGGGHTALTHTLAPGTYIVVVEGWGSGNSQYLRHGAYNLTTSCTPAMRLQTVPIGCSTTVSGHTASGTNVVGQASREHVFNFTIGALTAVTIDACQATFDIFVRIYSAVQQTEIASQDDGGCPAAYGGNRPKMVTVLPPGSYQLIVEGYANSQGAYNVSMECDVIATPAHSPAPTDAPTAVPTEAPTLTTASPTVHSTEIPSSMPTQSPSSAPTTAAMTRAPTLVPTEGPTFPPATIPATPSVATTPATISVATTVAPPATPTAAPPATTVAPTPLPTSMPSIDPVINSATNNGTQSRSMTTQSAAAIAAIILGVALLILLVVLLAAWVGRSRRSRSAKLPDQLVADMMEKAAASLTVANAAGRTNAFANPVYGEEQYAGYAP